MSMVKAKTKVKKKAISRRKQTSAANPLDELAQELALAIRLDRASILFVIAETEPVRIRGMQELTSKLQAMHYTVEIMDASRVPVGDIPQAIEQDTQRAHK